MLGSPDNLQKKKWLIILLAVFLLLLIIISIWQYLNVINKPQTIIRGVWVGAVDLSGQTKEQAAQLLQRVTDQKKINGQVINYQDSKYNLSFSINSQDLESSYSLVQYDLTRTIGDLMTIGRQQNRLLAYYDQVRHYWQPQKYLVIAEIDRVRLKNVLQSILAGAESPSNNARPKIVGQDVEIEEHTFGLGFDYDLLTQKVEERIVALSDEPIVTDLRFVEPAIKKEDVSDALVEKIRKIVQQDRVILLNYEEQKWEIEKGKYLPWLAFHKSDQQVRLVFDEQSVIEYLLKEVNPKIDKPAKDPKFSIVNGRVTEFQSSQAGISVEVEKLLAEINNQFFEEENNSFTIPVKETKPSQAVQDINDLGIVEIIGVGKSSFKGSPPNRVHNIKTGASAINGLVVKPGEIFSLVGALGKIDASNGYLPELVIKGNKTTPEYGGGLCQIGTTTFRAAVDSGLPITERRNHSYRVSYYEPAGTDATIYDPKPDFKFTNDTGSNVLIVTKVIGTDLRFEFWGKKDGRIIDYSKPRIFNIVKPGPTKLIETTDLKPGEKKCTEKPHSGADAEFDYKVIYSSGETKQQTFKSHYIPWPEVCLIGVEKPQEPSSGNNNEPLSNTPLSNTP